MKIPFNNRKRSFFNIKGIPLKAGVFFMLLFTFVGCIFNNEPEQHGCDPCRRPPVKAFIYGKVDSISAYNKQHKYFKYRRLKILVLEHREGCNKVDSTQSNAGIIAIATISKSGHYNKKLQIHRVPPSTCFSAALVSYDDFGGHSGTQSAFEYDTLLAGPKKFEVNFHTQPPYDSVKVNFVLSDSTKN